jgi:type 2 lantibiotic biosynthesis protein LanM
LIVAPEPALAEDLVLRWGLPHLVPSDGTTLTSRVPFQKVLEPLVANAFRALGATPELSLRAAQALTRSLTDLAASITSEALTSSQDLTKLLRDCAGLRETLNLALATWTECAGEFMSRLRADFPGRKVAALAPSLSDRHDGGRSVVIVQFTSGERLVYKPKDLRSEQAYFAVIDWMNKAGAPYPLRMLKVDSRQGYGWVEFAQPHGCESPEQVDLFYRRAGALLALLYALQGTDCHFDNLIASGDQPVLVDAEMLMQPSVRGSPIRDLSVMRTGLLPRPRVAAGSYRYDLSGLGAVYPQRTHLRIPRWRRGKMEFVPATLPIQSNVPLLRDRAVDPLDYVEPMVAGFETTYRFLLDCRTRLPDLVSPDLRLRFVIRETLEYYLALNRSLRAKNLSDRAGALQWLEPKQERFANLVGIERQSLLNLDVPRFTFRAGGTDLEDACGIVSPRCFVQSGYDRTADLVHHMSLADLKEQVETIRSAWALARLLRY